VYYFGASTIYEGMPVCYDNSTTNWLGVDGSSVDFTTTASSITEGTTTADGYQNEGKFIRVENVNADNISLFAGVVAGADHAGETGPRALDIYIPNGAVVPVRTDQNCLIDQTILAITTAQQELGAPLGTDSRPVAIARETVDRGTAGLVLAELNPGKFVHQDMGGTALSVDDASTGSDSVVNKIYVDFLQATGNCTALWVQAESGAGAAANGYGLALYVQADITATPSSHVGGASFWMNVTGGTPVVNLYVAEFGIYCDGAELAGASVYAASFRTQVDDACAKHYMFHFQADGVDKPDGLFYAYNAAAIGITASDGGVSTHKIPINIGGAVRYLMVSDG